MEIYSHPDIPEILSLPGNSTCCDCGIEKPKWASLNNGAFLCLKCAGIHRSLGVDISTIRSLQIDSWTDKQILYLSQGGNFKLQKIWEEYSIDPKDPVEKKYKSKAGDYYRKYLKNLVEKISDPDYVQVELIKPSTEEGKEMMEDKKGNEDVNNINIIGEFKEKKNEGGFFSMVGSFFSDVKKTATQAAGKISKGLDELKIKDKLREAGDKISDNAKIVGNYIKDKSHQALNSQFVQGITKTAESGINVVIEKTKHLLNKNEDAPQNVNVVMLNNEQNNNNMYGPDELALNQDIQMSNVVNNDINNINDKNNINEKNENINGNEVKGEEVKKEEIKNDEIKNEEIKKEEIKKEEIPKEEKVEEKKEENNNNVIENKKLEEQNVKLDQENPKEPSN